MGRDGKGRMGATKASRDKLIFVQISACWPEQYDVYDSAGCIVGYVRLKNGYFDVYWPDAGGEPIYTVDYRDSSMQQFESERERVGKLHTAARALIFRMRAQASG